MLGFKKKGKGAKDVEELTKVGGFAAYPHLMAMKPREKYVFRSDYFEVDDHVATIMGFFHDDAAVDNFPAFWGINRIPRGMPDEVTTVLLEQVRRMGESWTEERMQRSDKISQMDEVEQGNKGSATARRKAGKIAEDLDRIAGEVTDGASYLHVHDRLFVSAPNIEILDEATKNIAASYVDRFGTLRAAPYHGEQRRELSTLFAPNNKKRGKGFGFTSTEFAGKHYLVTHGLTDPTGEYVGTMTGDVNNSAVLFDINKYEHHVVVANDNHNDLLGRAYVSDVWGSKISQAAMLNNGRVVHLVLDGAKLDNLGPEFKNITYTMDMNNGDVNPFELFGDPADELNIFPAHLKKIVLMAEQAYEPTDSDRSIIRGELESILTQFYIDEKMWYRNAAHNRERLRLVGIPHSEVPPLARFQTHLETKHTALVNSGKNDPDQLHAYGVLKVVFKNMLDSNGDLFNTVTSDSIDGVTSGRRVIYDFGGLMRRGKGVAMAQLVNVVGVAVETLGVGDTVLIHGAEHIVPGVREYLNEQFEHMFSRGGRVAYLYNSIDKMLADKDFNNVEGADYTIFGSMKDTTVEKYQSVIGQNIPFDLARLIKMRDPDMNYLRRGEANVVFNARLSLGISSAKLEKMREAAKRRKNQVMTNADVEHKDREAAAQAADGELSSLSVDLDEPVKGAPAPRKKLTKAIGSTRK